MATLMHWSRGDRSKPWSGFMGAVDRAAVPWCANQGFPPKTLASKKLQLGEFFRAHSHRTLSDSVMRFLTRGDIPTGNRVR